jgi:transposase-like protein
MPAPRKYPLELRERAVRMYRTAEPKPVIRRMAEELGVHHEALRNWIRQAEADAGERNDILTTEEKDELAQLRREVRELHGRTRSCGRPRPFFAAQLDPTRPR